MSLSYVIQNTNATKILDTCKKHNIKTTKRGNQTLIEHNLNSIWLITNPQDPDNAWFIGYSITQTHPNKVLDHLISLISNNLLWTTENDDLYWELLDKADEKHNQTTRQHN